MSVSSDGQPESLFTFLIRRIRQDLQFSAIFMVDFVVTVAYLAATIALLPETDPTATGVYALITLTAAYVLLHLCKMAMMVTLERRGGDAREFTAGQALVTTGFWSWSRNPGYVVSLLESLLWSLALIILAKDQALAPLGYVAAPVLLYGHYWGMDRLIVPNEEAALEAAHPEEFAAYTSKVRRWFGRR